ncbi:MAG TPA: glycoside hydrolase family 127 protein [Vicinamibacterales bacterium]|nr:glycoside hydrolase family 127 protein [Vicinamibacterales bacterium]
MFPLSSVRLLDGPFKRAQELNLGYLRALEPDRLLAPYRREAGLEPKAKPYPNWESSGLDGHTAGHYLTALAQAWAATGDEEMKRRLDYMIGELAEYQRANGGGYVGAVPGGRQLWKEIAAGDIRAKPFELNGKWVPWYNLHKLFAGLRDAHVIGGNAQARDVLVALADWAERLTVKLTDEQMQEMLRAEHGGMNEVLADVYSLTGDKKYLAAARRFSHAALLEPLAKGEDVLTGMHANTQIPKVVGSARISELTGEPEGLSAARFFWETVVGRRSVAFGGNSVKEHFNPPDDFSEMIESPQGPETCNTYNMLRLTERLFAQKPAAEYADFYERALFNHILSTQHPEHGGFVYFTPIRPRHYRVYSQPAHCFWCCVGSGMENHGKHGRFVYARDAEGVIVNLFVASTLNWPEQGISVRQETGFPDTPRTTLVIGVRDPRRFTLRVRHPSWVSAEAFRVRINGEPWSGKSTPGSYAAITRDWRDGDRVEIELPMRTRLEELPDGSGYFAIVHGPIVLAAGTGTEQMTGLLAGEGRMDHVPSGPELPLDEAPTLAGDPVTIAEHIRPLPGRPLTFTASDVIRPAAARDLELIPFFRVHDTRYMVYWRVVPGPRALSSSRP